MLVLIVSSVTLVGCSDDDAPAVLVSVNGTVVFNNTDEFNGDIDGDFSSNGGTATKSFMWQNALATADYNADISTSVEGSFRMVVQDANGGVVLDRSLSGATAPDSISGVTTGGAPGLWTVTITLTSFTGDGSFSLSEGN
ncbi:hypothetical protein [Mariniflexile sp. AS56]|nr:hypothetical protein [Mariniflexile sp. AS56]